MPNIIPYSVYSDMLTQKHVMGKSDCLSLVRDLLLKAYGISIPNYARPEFFYLPQLDLFERVKQEEFWVKRPTLDLKDMQAGDILNFKVRSENVNHLGVYLGNRMFLHHLIGSNPNEESLSPVWMRRLDLVAYHRDMEIVTPKFSVIDLMPNYQKVQNYVE